MAACGGPDPAAANARLLEPADLPEGYVVSVDIPVRDQPYRPCAAAGAAVPTRTRTLSRGPAVVVETVTEHPNVAAADRAVREALSCGRPGTAVVRSRRLVVEVVATGGTESPTALLQRALRRLLGD